MKKAPALKNSSSPGNLNICFVASFLFALLSYPLYAQNHDTILTQMELKEIEIMGQKSTIASILIPRMLELIPADEIQNSGSQSFQDFIEFRSNIDIRQRGPIGIQSDISIRGGSFDQTLVLINGINVTDPQTGHHSLSLPFDIETIQKIEILNGPSTRALGANAYNGALNIVTTPMNKNNYTASINVGEFEYFRFHLGANQITKNTRNLITLGYSESAGYMHNTDFKNMHFYYNGEYNLNKNALLFTQIGLNKKGYGANGYYHPRYPDQFEDNKNIFFASGLKYGKTIKTKSQIYWRRFYDHFILFREQPELYQNYHFTDILGADFTGTYHSNIGKTSFGTSIRSERILSTQLGEKLENPIEVKNSDSAFYTNKGYRNNVEVYLEQTYQIKKTFISAGAMVNRSSFSSEKISVFPGIDIKYNLVNKLSAIASYNYTLGLPTFLDLNYQGPGNIGNSELEPYTQNSIEGGILYNSNILALKTVAFYSKGKNNIEWVSENNSEAYVFTPINIPISENSGMELTLNFKPKKSTSLHRYVSNVFIGYTFINTYRNISNNISKYSNIKHKLAFTLQQNFRKDFYLNWSFVYKERTGQYQFYNSDRGLYSSENYPTIFLLNLKACYKYSFANFYIELSNILDQVYYEAGSIPQPGRWIRGGIVLRFKESDERI